MYISSKPLQVFRFFVQTLYKNFSWKWNAEKIVAEPLLRNSFTEVRVREYHEDWNNFLQRRSTRDWRYWYVYMNSARIEACVARWALLGKDSPAAFLRNLEPLSLIYKSFVLARAQPRVQIGLGNVSGKWRPSLGRAAPTLLLGFRR